jgi:hypothetical protein
MLKESYPNHLANRPLGPNTDLDVLDKYTGDVATRVAMADAKAIDPTSACVKIMRKARCGPKPIQRAILIIGRRRWHSAADRSRWV